MPLPAGKWKMTVNGVEGTIDISQSRPEMFTATHSEFGRLEGFWDETSQTITFHVKEPDGIALFKGYLMRAAQGQEPGRDVMVTLAGSMQVAGSLVSFFNATARRNVFGWFAQITEVV